MYLERFAGRAGSARLGCVGVQASYGLRFGALGRALLLLRWKNSQEMAKKYYLPSAAALAVTFFSPAGWPMNWQRKDDILAVEYLGYGVIGGIQITSLSCNPIVVTSVLINNEFFPSLHAPREEGRGNYLRKGFPRRLSEYGCSFITITEAPAAPDHVRSLCYGKPVTEVMVSTNRGNFVFKVRGDS